MRYRTFSVRILEEVVDFVEADAAKEHRTRNQQIQKILADHYEHLLPVVTPNGSVAKKTIPARAKRDNHTN